MTHTDENIKQEDHLAEAHSCNCGHEHHEPEAEKTIPVKTPHQRFSPPIHGNKFGGSQNSRGNNQRPGRAAQRGR